MLPVTWPEFANIHPFAPLEQAAGYTEMIESLHKVGKIPYKMYIERELLYMISRCTRWVY